MTSFLDQLSDVSVSLAASLPDSAVKDVSRVLNFNASAPVVPESPFLPDHLQAYVLRHRKFKIAQAVARDQRLRRLAQTPALLSAARDDLELISRGLSGPFFNAPSSTSLESLGPSFADINEANGKLVRDASVEALHRLASSVRPKPTISTAIERGWLQFQQLINIGAYMLADALDLELELKGAERRLLETTRQLAKLPGYESLARAVDEYERARIFDSVFGASIAALDDLLSRPEELGLYLLEQMIAGGPGGIAGALLGRKAAEIAARRYLFNRLPPKLQQALTQSIVLAGVSGGSVATQTPGGVLQERLAAGVPLDSAVRDAISAGVTEAIVNAAVTAVPVPILRGLGGAAVTGLAKSAQQAAAGVLGAQAAAAAIGEEASPGELFLEAVFGALTAPVEIAEANILGRRRELESAMAELARKEAAAAEIESVAADLRSAAESLSNAELTATRNTFAQVLKRVAPETELVIDAAELRRAVESAGLSMADVFEAMPELRTSYANAVGIGGSISISVSDLLAHTVGTPLFEPILQSVRTHGEGLSLKEAEAFKNERLSEIQRALDSYAETVAKDPTSLQVYNELLGKIRSVHKFSPTVERAYASLAHKMYSQLASRLGITTKEAADRYPFELSVRPDDVVQQELPYLSVRDFTPDKISDILSYDGWAIFTAENPMGKSLPPEQNRMRNEMLRAELQRAGYRFVEVEGKYTDADDPSSAPLEHSFLIFGITVNDALRLANKYQQDSILTRHGLVYHDRTITPAVGVTTFDTPPDNFWSRIPETGASFRIELDFDTRLPAEQIFKQPVGTRVPKRSADAHLRKDTSVDYGLLKDAPEYAAKLADVLLEKHPMFKSASTEPYEVLEQFVNFVKDNLLTAYKAMPADIRERSRLWYSGAHGIAKLLANRYPGKYSLMQTAGVIAALSPQYDWYNNVSLAERLIDFHAVAESLEWTPEMGAVADELFSTDKKPADAAQALATLKADLYGKAYRDITDPFVRAVWFRVYDTAHNGNVARIITPEGGFTDKTQTFARSQSNERIAAGLRILDEGTLKAVSDSLGVRHKVRNFYNLIFDPQDVESVVIDTHAAAAGLLTPVSGISPEVKLLFDGPKNGKYGLYGTYVLYAEAYKRAASELGLRPSELQSIVWVWAQQAFASKRHGFTRAEAIELWKNTHEESAREAIVARSEPVAPVWGRFGPELHEGAWASSYRSDLRRDIGAAVPTAARASLTLHQSAEVLTAPPIEPDGSIVLYHYSSKPNLNTLDPKYYGTALAGAERKRKLNDPDNWVDRTYYGIAVGRPGGYEKEQGLGPYLYAARVPANRLYDFAKDPLALRPAATTGWDNPISLYERRIREAGYAGYWVKSSMGLVAAVFEPLQAERVDLLQQQGEARGEITLPADFSLSPAQITLLSKADLSTFIHELGHLFFEIYSRIAAGVEQKQERTAAEESILSDVKALLEFAVANNRANLAQYGLTAHTDYDSYIRAAVDKATVARAFAERIAAAGYRAEAFVFGRRVSAADDRDSLLNAITAEDAQAALAEANGVYAFAKALVVRVSATDEASFYGLVESISAVKPYEEIRPSFSDPRYIAALNIGGSLVWVEVYPEGLPFEQFASASEEQLSKAGAFYRGPYQPQAEKLLDLAKLDIAGLRIVPRPDGFNMRAFDNAPSVASWVSSSIDVRELAHETVARAYEAYLYIGRAPTQKLTRLFRQLSSWLKQAYTTLKDIGVELTPEVEGVFARMLAAEKDIARYKAMFAAGALFRSAADAGMTEEEFEAYKRLSTEMFESALDAHQAEQLSRLEWVGRRYVKAVESLKRTANKLREKYKKEGLELAKEDPTQIAVDMLRNGFVHEETTEDGKTVRRHVKVLLSKPALIERYGDGPDALWRLLPGGWLSERRGLHPDALAPLFGFESTDAFIKAIATAPTPDELAELYADERMHSEHQDLATDAAIQQKAAAKVHDDTRLRVLRMEYDALHKLQNRRPAVLAIASEADAILDELRVRDIKPGTYSRLAAKARRDSERAYRKGDLVRAIEAKRSEMLYVQLQRKAVERAEEYESDIEYLRSLTSKDRRQAMGADAVKVIDALLAVFAEQPEPNAIAVAMSALDNYRQLLESEGFIPALSTEFLPQLGNDPRALQWAVWRAYIDTLRQVEHFGKIRRQLLSAERYASLAEAKVRLVESIKANARTAGRLKIERKTWSERARSIVDQYLLGMRRFTSLLKQLDGGDTGAAWEILGAPLNAAGAYEAELRVQAAEYMRELISKLPDRDYVTPQLVPGTDISLSWEARLVIALNWGSESNRQRVRDGGLDGIRPLSDEEIAAILDTLTKEDWEFVQGVWDYLETFRPLIAEQERKHTGLEPVWIEPAPVSTKYGEFRGGYFPVKYDTDLSGRAQALHEAAELRLATKGVLGRAATDAYYTKTRVNRVRSMTIRKDLGVLADHLNTVIHRLAWQDWVADASRLLADRDVERAIIEHYGPEFLREMKRTVLDMATGETGPKSVYERWARHLRTGVSVVAMGWNVMTAILQLSGFATSVHRVGAKWVLHGLGEALSDTKKALTFMRERSQFMRQRLRTQHREMAEFLTELRGGKLHDFKASYFWLISRMQYLVDVPTWLGAYRRYEYEALNEGLPVEEAQKVASAKADQAIIDAQSSGLWKDLPRVMRDTELLRLFTAFYTYFNAVYNMLAELHTTRPKWQWPAGYALLIGVPVMYDVLIQAITKGECEDFECYAKMFASNSLSYALSTMVFVREVSGIAQGYFNYTGPGGLRVYAELGKTIRGLQDGEVDGSTVKAAINTAGILLHLPVTQPMRTIEGTYAVIEEDAPLSAVITGAP